MKSQKAKSPYFYIVLLSRQAYRHTGSLGGVRGTGVSTVLPEEGFPVGRAAYHFFADIAHLLRVLVKAGADARFMITKALYIRCGDAALLEALRLYQGRALYDGPLGEDALEPLAEKYGLQY